MIHVHVCIIVVVLIVFLISANKIVFSTILNIHIIAKCASGSLSMQFHRLNVCKCSQ